MLDLALSRPRIARGPRSWQFDKIKKNSRFYTMDRSSWLTLTDLRQWNFDDGKVGHIWNNVDFSLIWFWSGKVLGNREIMKVNSTYEFQAFIQFAGHFLQNRSPDTGLSPAPTSSRITLSGIQFRDKKNSTNRSVKYQSVRDAPNTWSAREMTRDYIHVYRSLMAPARDS